jgi:hypothetical protein
VMPPSKEAKPSGLGIGDGAVRQAISSSSLSGF